MSIPHQRITGWIAALLLFLASAIIALAQSSAVTYQGKLSDSGTPASGTYDLEFKLFDALAGGNQVGATVIRDDVAVASGIFTVTLDFGAAAFPGANRWLEIGVRAGVSTGAFTTLSPLQPITATPYAVRSLNASSADTVTVNGVPSGSGNYIQNGITPQAGANFNISGNGTIGGDLTVNGSLAINTVNAQTQFSLGGQRQRLSIARALVRKPDIYVFDDSFSALDLATDARLRAALGPYTKDAAVVIVAQRVSTIATADNILVLEDGVVIGRGTHDELMRDCPTYAEIVQSQIGEKSAA